MRWGIIGVSVLTSKLDGDPTIAGGRQDEEKLFQIRSMSFGVPIGDRGGTLTAQCPASGISVLTTEADRCGVVVEFIENHIEFPNGSHNDIGEQCRTIGIEEPIKRPAYGVVADCCRLIRLEAETLWGKTTDHFVLPVDRLSLDEKGPEKNTKRLAVGHSHAPVPGRNESIHARVQINACNEVVDQRERSQPFCCE